MKLERGDLRGLLAFVVFVCLNVTFAYSREPASVITEIEVTGLTRTRPFVVKNELEKFIGLDVADYDEKEIVAAMEDVFVVQFVSAELIEREDGFALSVTARDKWSLIPVPMVLSNKRGTTYGFGVMEANLFGTRDALIVGAVDGPFGWYSTVSYIHASRRNWLPGGMLIPLYGRTEVEHVDKNEDVHRRYWTEEIRFLGGINYSVTEEITASFISSYADIKLIKRDHVDNLAVPDEGALRICFNPGIRYRKREWDGYFMVQQSLSLNYNYYYAIEGTSYHQPEFAALYEKSLIPGFKLRLETGGVWKSEKDPLLEEGQNKAQVSILPRNFAALNLVGGMAGLEKYVYKAKWGTIALTASWQGVYYEGSIVDGGDRGSEFNHGPTAGMSFYLARLTVPAMGIVYSYNMDSDVYQIGLSLGAAF